MEIKKDFDNDHDVIFGLIDVRISVDEKKNPVNFTFLVFCNLEEFFRVGLGKICFILCLDLCYQTYVIITNIKHHF